MRSSGAWCWKCMAERLLANRAEHNASDPAGYPHREGLLQGGLEEMLAMGSSLCKPHWLGRHHEAQTRARQRLATQAVSASERPERDDPDRV